MFSDPSFSNFETSSSFVSPSRYFRCSDTEMSLAPTRTGCETGSSFSADSSGRIFRGGPFFFFNGVPAETLHSAQYQLLLELTTTSFMIRGTWQF